MIGNRSETDAGLIFQIIKSKNTFAHLNAAENVKMKMLYTLAGVFTAVGNDPVSVCNARIFCDFGNLFKDMRNVRAVAGINRIHRVNVLFGND
mgnify:CR=1 FL=1